jgi:ABC-type transport system substrate-binding protein/DNA-binding SARP family transcriptional activator
VEFGILGPVEVRRDGRAITIGGAKQRALLAVLLLHANEVVSRDLLIEALWGERPPPSVQQSLDTYVSRLRRTLGAERLVRRAPGYLVVVEPGELDLDRFEELVQRARHTERAASASECLRTALALWRGPALADVLYEPFAAIESTRLEERRLAALEDRVDADLAAGGGAELVPELQALVREHPLRERLVGQLMLALYRAGRQAEALATLQEARHRLVGELGLEPGPQLRALELQILQQDPELHPRRPRLLRKPPRARLLAAAATLLGLVAVAVTAVLVGGGETTPPADADAKNRLLSIEDGSGRSVHEIELGGAPSAVAVGLGSIWAAQPSQHEVVKLDPSSGSVVDVISVGAQPGRLTTGGGAVWVASTLGGQISRIDPESNLVTQTIRLGGANAADVAFGEGSVWVADSTDHSLIEIDPDSGSVRRTVTLDIAPGSLGIGEGLVWVTGYETGTVEAISTRSGKVVATVSVGEGLTAIAVTRDAVWVVNNLGSTVSRIDPQTDSVKATIPVPSGPSSVAATPHAVWVASADAASLSQIDPDTDAVVASRRVGGRPEAVAVGGDRIWLGAGSRGEPHRGGTLILVRSRAFSTIDPALNTDTAFAFIRLAYDTLTTLQPASGPAGLRLLPDLAVSLPKPTNGGKTYVFRIRPGIRYSDGRLLRARDFRRAIERMFRVDSPGSGYYSALVGAGACRATPRRCNLERGIETDESTRTVTFHLRVPDPDFLYKLAVLAYAAPVPPGVAERPGETRPVPGTGPYRIASVTRRELRLVRNPYFHKWSHAAQPDGNPDVIVWRVAGSRRAAVDEVARGRADWFFGLVPASYLRSLRLRYPSQLHANPTTIVDFIPLNTRRPPFDDVRVRRALNYAIDRAKIARWYGGPLVATPLCQPLAPGLPGYSRYCPYTRRPRADGRWSGPDLAKARRLVAATGTQGEHVEVWGAPDVGGVPPPVPRYVARVLRSLGYDVQLRLVPFASITSEARRHFQLSVDGDWLPDYPAPSAYLPGFFGCDGGFGNGFVCDPALDRAMARASALQLTDPARAAALWAGVNRRLVDQAYWVPTVSVHDVVFTSKRLRNVQFSPIGDFIADQVWLR